MLLQRFAGKEGRRFARFLVVGAVGFVVDFGVFKVEHALGFGAWLAARFLPALLSQPAVIEQTISQGVAIISNFIWNYFWIYPEARAAKQTGKMAKFVLVSVLGLIIGIPIFSAALLAWQWLLTLAQPSGAWAGYAATLALMTRVGILLFWNFLVNRLWTYREVK